MRDLLAEGGLDVLDIAEIAVWGDVGGTAAGPGQVWILDDGADQGVVVEGGGKVFSDEDGGKDLLDGVLVGAAVAGLRLCRRGRESGCGKPEAGEAGGGKKAAAAQDGLRGGVEGVSLV